MAPPHGYICGCYYLLPPASKWSVATKKYIAQVSSKVHTTILATTSRTSLTQTFVNPSEHKAIKELSYSFPLYDGVSVVGFTCKIGDRVIKGEVKEKEKARAEYKEAKERGEVAGLLEQLPEASDVFITKLGNVPPGSSIIVEITYLGELKHDAEVDGVRFTIPSYIAPRYGEYPSAVSNDAWQTYPVTVKKGFEIVVDAELGEGAYIREMRSPSHPIAVSLGTTSLATEADPTPNKASATLSLSTAELDKDFVLQVVAKETAIPKAMLETHPTIPGQRALMATLVPKFNLPAERPEIVFVCDRSGSMMGNKIVALRNALKVFLKSLPLGTKFNICSFGSSCSFLWPKSASYSQQSLEDAMKHVEKFDANYGGTEMYRPMEETIKRRYKDMNLEIFLVTDGEIWDQQKLFDLLNKEIGEKTAPIRVFTLGVGDAFSSSLIEGVARAGNGFSQAVGENEKLDGKVVRMLKAALSPHINDYTLEVEYADGTVDKAVESLSITVDDSSVRTSPSLGSRLKKSAISLFDTSADPNASEPSTSKDDKDGQGRYAHLPTISAPNLLQAPYKIPPLFPFSRTTVYLLISPLTSQTQPVAVVLKATSKHGPLELAIPIQVLDQPGETIHQLAAKKAVHELEEGRGWLASAKDAASGQSLKEKHEGRFEEFVEREAVRLGVQFQVGGKFCSFVAVERNNDADKVKVAQAMDEDWEFLDEEVNNLNLGEGGSAVNLYVHDSQPHWVGKKKKCRSSAAPVFSGPGSTSGSRADLYGRDSARAPRRKGGVSVFGALKRSVAAPRAAMAPALGGPPPAMMYQQTLQSPFGGSGYNSMAPASPAYAPTAYGASPGSAIANSAASAPSYGAPTRGLARTAKGGWMAKKVATPAVFGAAATVPPPPPAREQAVEKDKAFERTFSQDDFVAALPDDSEEDDEDMEMEDASPIPLTARDRINAITERGYALSADESAKKQELAPTVYKPTPKPAPPVDPLQALIELQTFEGFWTLSGKLCAAVGVGQVKVEKLAKEKGLDLRIVATALAVRYLTTRLKDQEESWELVVEKAKNWLEGEGQSEESALWKSVEGLL